eukprot:4092801-Heterocapsa_arctica.AAC.1
MAHPSRCTLMRKACTVQGSMGIKLRRPRRGVGVSGHFELRRLFALAQATLARPAAGRRDAGTPAQRQKGSPGPAGAIADS